LPVQVIKPSPGSFLTLTILFGLPLAQQGAGHVPTGGSTGESGKRVEAKKPDGPCDRKHRRKLIAAQRKLLFFTAWANEQRNDVFSLLEERCSDTWNSLATTFSVSNTAVEKEGILLQP